MAMSIKEGNLAVKGKAVNIGVDVHRRSWRVTALVEGVIVLSGSSPPSCQAFKTLLRRFEGATIRVAYEAGPAGFALYDRLAEDGVECIVTSPSLISTGSGNRVKTDKIDSYKLAIQTLPGAAAKLNQQFAIMQEEAAEDFGDGEDEVPIRDGPEHMTAEPLAELHGPFLPAAEAELPFFTTERQKPFRAAGVAPDAGKTCV